MYVTLHFDMTIEVDELDGIDGLGNDIARDVLGELFNGDDVLEVKYRGHTEIIRNV